MAKSQSVIETLVATAHRKVEAAGARTQADPTLEKPKDAIRAGCLMIAAALAGDGYAFIKTNPRLRRIAGDLRFEIVFQADRFNIPGRRAAVYIHGGVSSVALREWRRDHPHDWIRDDGAHTEAVIGGQIGNFGAAPGWMEWDFADPATRAGVADDAVKTIRDLILPFFALFESPTPDFAGLAPLWPLWRGSFFEYILCTQGRAAAEAAGRAFLIANPTLRPRFEAGRTDVRQNGVPVHHADMAYDLAAYEIVADLDLTR